MEDVDKQEGSSSSYEEETDEEWEEERLKQQATFEKELVGIQIYPSDATTLDIFSIVTCVFSCLPHSIAFNFREMIISKKVNMMKPYLAIPKA